MNFLKLYHSEIIDRFKRGELTFITIKVQFLRLEEVDSGFKQVSVNTYRKYFIDSGIAIYKTYEKISPTCNEEKNKSIRQIVLRLLLESIFSGRLILFFDESNFQHSSFRKKAWGPKNQRLFLKSHSSYP